MSARLALAAALATLAVGSAAQAQDLHLRYGDLDLSRPEQARELDRRIDGQAKAFCPHEVRTGTLERSPWCEANVRTELLNALPSPVRASYEQGRHGRSAAFTVARAADR